MDYATRVDNGNLEIARYSLFSVDLIIRELAFAYIKTHLL